MGFTTGTATVLFLLLLSVPETTTQSPALLLSFEVCRGFTNQLLALYNGVALARDLDVHGVLAPELHSGYSHAADCALGAECDGSDTALAFETLFDESKVLGQMPTESQWATLLQAPDMVELAVEPLLARSCAGYRCAGVRVADGTCLCPG